VENANLVMEIVKHVIRQLKNAQLVNQMKFFTKKNAINNALHPHLNK